MGAMSLLLSLDSLEYPGVWVAAEVGTIPRRTTTGRNVNRIYPRGSITSAVNLSFDE